MGYPDCGTDLCEGRLPRADRGTSAEEGAMSRVDRDTSTKARTAPHVDDGTGSARKALILTGALVALTFVCGLGALSLCASRGAAAPPSLSDAAAPDAPVSDSPASGTSANEEPKPSQITASTMGGEGSSSDGFDADEVEYTLEITPPTKLLWDGT